jgi:hypothetical protein
MNQHGWGDAWSAMPSDDLRSRAAEPRPLNLPVEPSAAGEGHVEEDRLAPGLRSGPQLAGRPLYVEAMNAPTAGSCGDAPGVQPKFNAKDRGPTTFESS